MTTFDHVILLLSFVYAFGFAHLLSRVGAVINGSQKVWSGLLAVAVVNATFNLLMNWLALLGFRNQSDWSFLDILVQLATAVALYFWCYVALPEVPTEGTIDLEAIYWKQRRKFYIVGLVVAVVSIADNLEFLKTPNASEVLLDNILVVALAPLLLLPLLRTERWAQWVGGAGLLTLTSLYTIYSWKNL
jgi:hypothetical protein